MLKIKLIAVGDIKEKYLSDAIQEYKKRISRFADLTVVEIKENVAKSSHEKDVLSALEKDATEILKHAKGHIICLDIAGKLISSEDFASKLITLSLTTSEISFIIGASNGLSQTLKNQANERWSFSLMTFPHQLMRVIFLEQLYRALTINNNVAYHK